MKHESDFVKEAEEDPPTNISTVSSSGENSVSAPSKRPRPRSKRPRSKRPRSKKYDSHSHSSCILYTSMSSASRQSPVAWDPKTTTEFVRILLEEKCKIQTGSRANMGLPWVAITKSVKERCNVTYTAEQLTSKYRRLKTEWQTYHDLKTKMLSGAGWDHLTKTVDTSSEVWQQEIAKNNKLEKYQYEPLSDYEDLCALFMGNTATGHFSRSSNQAPIGSDSEDESERSYFSNSSKRAKSSEGTGSARSSKRTKSGLDFEFVATLKELAESLKVKEPPFGSCEPKYEAEHLLPECLEQFSKMEGLTTRQEMLAKSSFKKLEERLFFLNLSDEAKRLWLDTLK